MNRNEFAERLARVSGASNDAFYPERPVTQLNVRRQVITEHNDTEFFRRLSAEQCLRADKAERERDNWREAFCWLVIAFSAAVVGIIWAVATR